MKDRPQVVEELIEDLGLEREEAIRCGLIPEVCRVCGCSDDDGCVNGTGMLLGGLAQISDRPVCCWVLPDLCSSCAVGWAVVQPGRTWTDVDVFLEGWRQYAAGRAGA